MSFLIYQCDTSRFPRGLDEIPQPPKKLYYAGALPHGNNKILAVVGARKYTPYGKQVCEDLIDGLRGQPITIVSGLALGIDSIAHRAALRNGLQTIAIPGSGLDPNVLYPRSHVGLAQEIIKNGGGLLSEFEPNFTATPYSFPQRNRIMAGISDAILVIEAEQKSGTLITARMATDYNKDVLAVPGSLYSKNSSGPHLLLKLGATPVTCAEDILEALHLEQKQTQLPLEEDCSPDEQKVLGHLSFPRSRDELCELTELPIHSISSILMMLEIKGFVREEAGLIMKR